MIDVEVAWSTIFGQVEAGAALRSWAADPLHAYHFVGPSGTGKMQAARAFAAAVQALHLGGPDGADDEARDRQMRLAPEIGRASGWERG